MNSCVLIGRLARAPELRFVPSSGMAVTKMTLAIDKDMSKEKKEQAKAQGQPTADFINITVFGKMAESCVNYLAKGSQCAISGRINTGSYTAQDGTKRYTTDVIADRVEFIGSKNEGQVKPQGGGFPDEDIFTPVDPDFDAPF